MTSSYPCSQRLGPRAPHALTSLSGISWTCFVVPSSPFTGRCAGVSNGKATAPSRLWSRLVRGLPAFPLAFLHLRNAKKNGSEGIINTGPAAIPGSDPLCTLQQLLPWLKAEVFSSLAPACSAVHSSLCSTLLHSRLHRLGKT